MSAKLQHEHPLFLASVTDADEAQLVIAGGADLIDCKAPASGALGALPTSEVRRIAVSVAGRVPVSATIGDHPCQPEPVCRAVVEMAVTGVDFIKVGLFDGGFPRQTIQAVSKLDIGSSRLVAVLFADRQPDLSLLDDLSQAGFWGVMLDTADKGHGALPDAMSAPAISHFVRRASEEGLKTGLAGSLKLHHIDEIRALGPDIIGFRGALCVNALREGELSPAAIAAVHRALSSQRYEMPPMAKSPVIL